MAEGTHILGILAQSVPTVSELSTPQERDCAKGQPAKLDIAQVTAGIRRGSEAHFLEFYEEYSPRLFKFLVLLTSGNEEASRDLHQEVLVKAAQNMRVFQSEENLWGWLSQVARNSWIDWLRRSNRRALREQAEERVTHGESEEQTAHEMAEYLEADLERLSKDERDLLNLFYFEEESQKTIAERTGRTVKAVESELARIRRKLKSFLLKRLHEKK